MRTKSTLLIILIVFLSHNHSTLGQSIIPHWTFTRIFTLYNSMCNSITTPIKTRLARIGSIFGTIWNNWNKKQPVVIEEIELIDASTIPKAPEQSEYEDLQQKLKNRNKQVLSIIDEHTKKTKRTLTTATLLGSGSIATLHGLGKTPVPQLMAHYYTRFQIASVLPVLNVAYPFILPAATLLIGGLTAWRTRSTMNKQQKGFKTKLDEATASFNEQLERLELNCLRSQGHPHCNNNINALNTKLNMKFEDLAQRLENISKRTQYALTNLERLNVDTEESEKNIFNSTKEQLTEICTLMASAKEEDEKTTKEIEDFFPQLKRLEQSEEASFINP